MGQFIAKGSWNSKHEMLMEYISSEHCLGAPQHCRMIIHEQCEAVASLMWSDLGLAREEKWAENETLWNPHSYKQKLHHHMSFLAEIALEPAPLTMIISCRSH